MLIARLYVAQKMLSSHRIHEKMLALGLIPRPALNFFFKLLKGSNHQIFTKVRWFISEVKM